MTTAPTHPQQRGRAGVDRQPPPAPRRPRPPTSAPTATTPQIVTSLGAYADHESLANVRPANPSTILLTVFNASTVRGQAKAVTDELRAAGFESMLASGNDPLYPASDLGCVAQIRYGPAGAAAARTVLLVAPCAQLVVDSRVDDSVDLALGGRYIYDSVSSDGQGPAQGHPGGGDPAGRDRGADRGRQAVAADPRVAHRQPARADGRPALTATPGADADCAVCGIRISTISRTPRPDPGGDPSRDRPPAPNRPNRRGARVATEPARHGIRHRHRRHRDQGRHRRPARRRADRRAVPAATPRSRRPRRRSPRPPARSPRTSTTRARSASTFPAWC